MTPGRFIAVVLILGGIAFGLWGGLFSTLDWWKLKQRVENERQAIERLEAEGAEYDQRGATRFWDCSNPVAV